MLSCFHRRRWESDNHSSAHRRYPILAFSRRPAKATPLRGGCLGRYHNWVTPSGSRNLWATAVSSFTEIFEQGPQETRPCLSSPKSLPLQGKVAARRADGRGSRHFNIFYYNAQKPAQSAPAGPAKRRPLDTASPCTPRRTAHRPAQPARSPFPFSLFPVPCSLTLTTNSRPIPFTSLKCLHPVELDQKLVVCGGAGRGDRRGCGAQSGRNWTMSGAIPQNRPGFAIFVS